MTVPFILYISSANFVKPIKVSASQSIKSTKQNYWIESCPSKTHQRIFRYLLGKELNEINCRPMRVKIMWKWTDQSLWNWILVHISLIRCMSNEPRTASLKGKLFYNIIWFLCYLAIATNIVHNKEAQVGTFPDMNKVVK